MTPCIKDLNQKKYLIVSNHISWLDIIVIQSIKPSIFVAKSDVASWPLFGWVAHMTGTIFIKREKVSDIKKTLRKMKRRLNKRSVCIFPEGTSTNGRYILPFKSNLFQSSIDSDRAILPICLRYEDNNAYTDKTAFIGDMSLIDSIMKIKNEKEIWDRSDCSGSPFCSGIGNRHQCKRGIFYERRSWDRGHLAAERRNHLALARGPHVGVRVRWRNTVFRE